MFRRHRLAVLAVAFATSAILALAACGGSASKQTASQENDEKFVSFAKCMREHGLNVSTSPGAIKINSANPRTLQAAQNACKRYQPSARKENVSPAQRAAAEDAALKFAKCMRSHGINVPNPTVTGEGGIGIKIQGGPGSVNPSGANFQAAQKACQGLLPKPPGAPAGAGFNTGGPGSPGSGASLSLRTGG
jgi:hypothetical protein